jgi:predicted phage terminase large subunit-like protein
MSSPVSQNTTTRSVPSTNPAAWRKATYLVTVLENPWIPHRPTQRQTCFLTEPALEVLYGGAGGGGKSDALLMAAAQYVEVPGYSALLLRRTYQDLALPGALMDRSKAWWKGRKVNGQQARWDDKNKAWRFPSGASITFGYLEHEDDKYRYASAEFQFIGFDELTQFSETQYTFLSSRLRRLADSRVPLRKRSATNPVGPGRSWVRKRFIPDDAMRVGEDEFFFYIWYNDGRAFIPARLEDNPHLDIATYDQSLEHLDPVSKAQIRRGDWKAHAGGQFRPEWWKFYQDFGDAIRLSPTDRLLAKGQLPTIVVVDPANSKRKTSKYTAIGVFADLGMDRLAVLEVVRERLSVNEIVPRVEQVCRRHHPVDFVAFEADGFQQGLAHEARDGTKYPAIPQVVELSHEGRSKLSRATKAIYAARDGRIYLPEEAPWLEEYIAELGMFTGDDKQDSYTDCVDVTAYAVNELGRFGGGCDEVPPPLNFRRPGPFW